jgi:hypothetical protein
MMREDNVRFDKFTERARKVLSLAQEEAQRFNHNFIGTEHLLLGLVREGDGVAAKVLAQMGVELPQVRRRVEFIIGRGDRIVLGEIGLTPRAKKVIELAVDEARRLNHHYIGTEHLLLGLIREEEGIAAGVLAELGVNLEKARTMTIQVVGQASRAYHADPTAESGRARLRNPASSPYQPYHITSAAPDRTPIGARAEQQTGMATLLGWVVVNSGGDFTLTLYQGMAPDAPKVAVIANPPTGAYFPYHCLLEPGLAYTLEGTPGSVTIVYADVSLA